MKLVGLTGGIGSGKTFCARIFEEIGVPVYYADSAAKKLMTDDQDLKRSIIDLFGPRSYSEDDVLNRAFLASVVFENSEMLDALNGLVHPAVRKDFIAWGSRHLSEPYVIQESAILFETGSYRLFDKTILVYAPEKIRMERIMRRDNISMEAVKSRMANQWPQEKLISLAHYIVQNDGTTSILPQLLKIHWDLISGNGADEEQ